MRITKMDIKTILFIDDEHYRMDAHVLYLSNHGYDLIYASDFDMAMVQFENNVENIDLIVLDIMMPVDTTKLTAEERKIVQYGDCTGLVLFDRFEKIRKITTIILTVRQDMEKYIKDRDIQFYMTKPIRPVDLLKKIKDII